MSLFIVFINHLSSYVWTSWRYEQPIRSRGEIIDQILSYVCAGLSESQRTRCIRQKGRAYGTCVWMVWCSLTRQIYMYSIALFGVISMPSRAIRPNMFIEVPDMRGLFPEFRPPRSALSIIITTFVLYWFRTCSAILSDVNSRTVLINRDIQMRFLHVSLRQCYSKWISRALFVRSMVLCPRVRVIV